MKNLCLCDMKWDGQSIFTSIRQEYGQSGRQLRKQMVIEGPLHMHPEKKQCGWRLLTGQECNSRMSFADNEFNPCMTCYYPQSVGFLCGLLCNKHPDIPVTYLASMRFFSSFIYRLSISQAIHLNAIHA